MTLEQRMNAALQTLGLTHWQAVWTPRDEGDHHGECLLADKLIVVYDENEKAAWKTFAHEVLELKMRAAFRPYRLLCNSLIDVIDTLAYAEKERFLDDLPRTLEILNAETLEGS